MSNKGMWAALALLGAAAVVGSKSSKSKEEQERDYLLNEYVPKATGPTKSQKCPKCGYFIGYCVYDCVVHCKNCSRTIYIKNGKVSGWR